MQLDTTLATVLNFTQEDLISNRAGKLTLRQIDNLRRYVHRQEPGCVIGTLFFSAVAFVMGAGIKSLVVGITVGLVTLVLLTILTIYFNRRAEHSLKVGDVKTATGTASVKIHEVHGKYATTNYYVTVGGVTFDVDSGIYRVFQEGVAYQVYYVLLLADTIVSAELI